MKNRFLILILIVLCVNNGVCIAAVGCMDNSCHLACCYDTKAYHYVLCTCPCLDKVDDRSQCIICRHYHEASPWRIATVSYPTRNQGIAKRRVIWGEALRKRLFDRYARRFASQ